MRLPSEIRKRVSGIVRRVYSEEGYDAPEELRCALENLVQEAASSSLAKNNFDTETMKALQNLLNAIPEDPEYAEQGELEAFDWAIDAARKLAYPE